MITCGFIGLGSQGAPIARRMIDAGFPTTLWARRPEALEPYRATAARYAKTIADLGAAAEHVGICVVNDDDVRQVCDQLIPAMRPGGRIAIHSTIHPRTCLAVEAQAAERGVHVIDAPVSGGPIVAQAGELTVMLGGDPKVIAAAQPVFESFGRLIVRLGGVGAGQHAKLINNALLAAHMGLAHNALAAGAALGIERAALAELVTASSGRSYGMEVCARLPSLTAFAHGAALLEKDVRLLGEVLGEDDPAFGALNDAATPFLDLALGR
jgi:3-hydroxyisobutyrate dehydrogenase-like beta-hydroxyacid dehydrogenase